MPTHLCQRDLGTVCLICCGISSVCSKDAVYFPSSPAQAAFRSFITEGQVLISGRLPPSSSPASSRGCPQTQKIEVKTSSKLPAFLPNSPLPPLLPVVPISPSGTARRARFWPFLGASQIPAPLADPGQVPSKLRLCADAGPLSLPKSPDASSPCLPVALSGR